MVSSGSCVIGVPTHIRTPDAATWRIAMARPSGLERRLLAILNERRRRRILPRTTIVILVALFAGVVLPVGMMRAMANEPEPAPKPDRFVRLVVGTDRMTLEGAETT